VKSYFPTSHAILETRVWLDLSPSAKVLYQILMKLENRYGGEHGWFFRSSRDLATDTSLNKSTISKALKELKEASLIMLEAPEQLDKGHAQRVQLTIYGEVKSKKKQPPKKRRYVRIKRT
jgi:DNA-binding MarR family transcriptional regulator